MCVCVCVCVRAHALAGGGCWRGDKETGFGAACPPASFTGCRRVPRAPQLLGGVPPSPPPHHVDVSHQRKEQAAASAAHRASQAQRDQQQQQQQRQQQQQQRQQPAAANLANGVSGMQVGCPGCFPQPAALPAGTFAHMHGRACRRCHPRPPLEQLGTCFPSLAPLPPSAALQLDDMDDLAADGHGPSNSMGPPPGGAWDGLPAVLLEPALLFSAPPAGRRASRPACLMHGHASAAAVGLLRALPAARKPRATPAAPKRAAAAATGRGKQAKLTGGSRQSPLNLTTTSGRGTQQGDNSSTVGVAAGRRGSSRAAAAKAQEKVKATYK